MSNTPLLGSAGEGAASKGAAPSFVQFTGSESHPEQLYPRNAHGNHQWVRGAEFGELLVMLWAGATCATLQMRMQCVSVDVNLRPEAMRKLAAQLLGAAEHIERSAS